MRKPRLLLVEDDPDDHLTVSELLSEIEDPRWQLTWASTYDQGAEALRRGEFEACLLDVRLGPRDGLSLLKEAVQAGCRVPIILLTGAASRDVDVEAMHNGAADYLVKSRIDVHQLER